MTDYEKGLERLKQADETLANQITNGSKMVSTSFIEKLADCSNEQFENDLTVIKWFAFFNKKKTTFPRPYYGVMSKMVRGLKKKA